VTFTAEDARASGVAETAAGGGVMDRVDMVFLTAASA
jgi:hypothetical protein